MNLKQIGRDGEREDRCVREKKVNSKTCRSVGVAFIYLTGITR